MAELDQSRNISLQEGKAQLRPSCIRRLRQAHHLPFTCDAVIPRVELNFTCVKFTRGDHSNMLKAPHVQIINSNVSSNSHGEKQNSLMSLLGLMRSLRCIIFQHIKKKRQSKTHSIHVEHCSATVHITAAKLSISVLVTSLHTTEPLQQTLHCIKLGRLSNPLAQ